MNLIEKLPFNKEILYEDNYQYQDWRQKLYFQKSILKGNQKTQYFLKSYIIHNGILVCQGYIYFYLDSALKTSDFIGLYIKPEYRNSGLSSFLVSSWIQFCLNNHYEFLGTNKSQRKPFLLYLLKKYGFEILKNHIYDTSNNVIHICRENDNPIKYLFFENKKQEENFIRGKIYKEDNYQLISEISKNIYDLGKVILSEIYNMDDVSKANKKSSLVLKKQRK